MLLEIFSLTLIFHFLEYKTKKNEIFIIIKKIKFIIDVIFLKKKNFFIGCKD